MPRLAWVLLGCIGISHSLRRKVGSTLSKKWSESSMSYDTKGRIITYSTVDWDYSFCYNKEGQLVSCRKISYHLNFGKRGEKSKEIEDRFEYGGDGNLLHTIRYIIGDISIINSGLEYEYVSQDVKTGEEFRDHNRKSSRDMLCVCKISLPGPSIAPYIENKLKEFVSERKALNREFKKSGSTYYTLFLRYYLQK